MGEQLFSELDSVVDGWERIPSVDDVHASLLDAVENGGLEVLLLGASQDGTPLLAFGDPDDERPRMLIIGGGSGDSVLSIAVSAELLQARQQLLPGWNVWAICAADPARARLNVGTLGQVRPKAADHAVQRRLAWGPGEDPERNLPIDHGLLYQPQSGLDGLPDDWVPSSPESIALARAINHLRPDLTVSLREVPAGGTTIGCSQELSDEDYRSLVSAIASERLPVFAAGKHREGRQVHGQPGLLVLPSVDDEISRAGDVEDGTRLLGGVGIWQALSAVNPDALYLTVDVPRFVAPALTDDGESSETRDVIVEIEDRERKGQPTPFRVIRLHRPGHPAHEQELRVEPAKGDGFAAGRHEQVPVASGWLAVEAHLERRQVLRDALSAFERCLPQLEHQDHLRSMQLLRAMVDGQENLLVGYQSNKRYGRRATTSEAFYWTVVFPFLTALILAEARRGLDRENQEDREVQATLATLNDLLDGQLAPAGALTAAPLGDAAKLMARFAVAAAEMTQAGGPALLAATQRRDRAQKTLFAKRKRARHARHLKLPKAEREIADRELAEAERELERCEAALQALTANDEPQQQPQAPAESPEPSATDPVEQHGPDARATEAEEAEEASADAPDESDSQHSGSEDVSDRRSPETESAPSETEEDDPAAVGQIAAVEEPSLDGDDQPASEQPHPQTPADQVEQNLGSGSDTPGLPDGDQEAEAPRAEEAFGEDLRALIDELAHGPRSDTPAQEQDAQPSEPQPIDSVDHSDEADPHPDAGSAAQQAEPEDDGEPNVEMLLPRHLQLPAEWGRGPMVWEHQLPDREDPPPFRRMIKELMEGGRAENAAVEPAPQPFSEPEDDSSAQLEPVEPTQNIGELHGNTVGFRRRRVDLRGRPPEVIPQMAPVSATGGRFERRRRRIPIS